MLGRWGRTKSPKSLTECVATMDDHARKAAKNESLFRDVNERIDELVGEAWSPEFVCECPDEHCIEAVEISLEEYESIRTSPVRFAIMPGHDHPDFERVVEQNERYALVEKLGEAAEVARKLDPRSRA